MINKVCLFVIALFAITAQAAFAGPMLKLSPSSESHDNGTTFDVVVGMDSGTAKTMAVDSWLTFDASKLEVVSIEAVTTGTTAFVFTMGKNIYNADGKIDMSFNPAGDSVISDAGVARGDLATVKFRAKATGSAAVNFTCTAGSTIDTNIFDTTGNDVIDCASNVNGSYTIGAGSGVAPTSTPVVNNVTAAAGELPRTGGLSTTLGLMIFGLVGTLAGVALRWL